MAQNIVWCKQDLRDLVLSYISTSQCSLSAPLTCGWLWPIEVHIRLFPARKCGRKGEKSLALKKPLRSVFLIGCFTQSLLWLDRLSLVWGTAFSVSGLSASPSLVELVGAVRNLYFSFSWQLACHCSRLWNGGGLKGHMSCGSLAYIAPPSPCHVTMIGN